MSAGGAGNYKPRERGAAALENNASLDKVARYTAAADQARK